MNTFEDAPCRMNPDMWFPSRTNAGAQAKRVCATCPYTGLWGPCADLGATAAYGVWAGMHPTTIRQRRSNDVRTSTT